MDSRPIQKNFSSESASSPLLVYVDGSCMQDNDGTRKAGYGIYAKSAVHNVQISEPLPTDEQTSQHAELKALLSGLELVWALRPRRAIICTDSQYAANGYNKWLSSWSNNDWCKSDGNEIAYKDVWEGVYDYMVDDGPFSKRGINVSVKWVARNSSSEQERADYLAKLGCTLHKRCGLCGEYRYGRKGAATHRCTPVCSKGSCKGSERRFQSLKAYQQHVEDCHSTRVACRLPGCDAVFGSEKARDSHEDGAHDGYVFECDYCSDTFQDEDDKDEHETDECENAPYCRPCDRWFVNRRALEQHDEAVHDY